MGGPAAILRVPINVPVVIHFEALHYHSLGARLAREQKQTSGQASTTLFCLCSSVCIAFHPEPHC